MATEKSVFDIVYALKKTGNAPEEVAKGLDKATEAAKKNERQNKALNNALKAVQGAAILAGTAFLKSIPALVQQGNSVNKAMTALSAYAGGAKQAEDAINAVVAASNNSISDFQAAETANRFFAMGLASTAEEAAKLTEMAITLGGAMGKDAAGAVEEFGLLLANQSVQRLDTFGVSAGKVRELMAQLAVETGRTDREWLFMTATMKIAEQQLTTLGEAGFSATDNVARLRAEVENAKDGMAVWFSDGLMPIIDGFFALRDAVRGNIADLAGGATDYDNYLARLREWRQLNPVLSGAVETLNEAQFDNIELTKESNRINAERADLEQQLIDLAAIQESQNVALVISMEAVMASIGGGLGPAYDEHAEKVGLLTARNDVLKKMLLDLSQNGFDPLSEEVLAITKEITENDLAIMSETESLKKLTSELIFNQIASNLNAEAALALGRSLGLVDEKTFQTALAAEELSKKWDAMDGALDGVITDTQGFAAEAAILRDTLAGIPAEVITEVETNVTTTFTTVGNPPVWFTPDNDPNNLGPQAHGGTHTVSGQAGNDRVPVRMMAKPGEKIQVTPPTGATPSGGGGGAGGRDINIDTVILSNQIDLDMFLNKIKAAA